MRPHRGSKRPRDARPTWRRRVLLTAACALALALATATCVNAAAAGPGGLLIAPTRIDVQVRPGESLPPIALRNGTDRTLVIEVAAVPARQELSGLPSFDLSESSLRQGRRMLRVSPRRLRLAPGARARVGAIAGSPTRRGQVGVYAVVAFTARQAQQSDKPGAVVTPTIRLTTNLLLRYPGPVRLDGRASALRVEQAPKRTLRFLARIRNTGDLHVRPRARLTITAATGRPVVRRAVRRENVLPGAERELPLDITTLLPAGTYRARVDARVGRRRSSRRIDFTLVGPNQLPTAKLRIVSLPTPQPDAGEPFDVALGLQNSGTGPITAAGTLTLTATGNQRTLARRPLRPPELLAGSRRQLTIGLPGVPAGSYTLTARFANGPLVLTERTVVFHTGTRPSLLDRLQDWLAGHIPLLLAGFGALLLLVVGSLVAYIRRLRSKLPPQD